MTEHTNMGQSGDSPLPTYLTDGRRLYEVLARRTVQNFGLLRGHITYTIIGDVITEATATVDDLTLATLTVVR